MSHFYPLEVVDRDRETHLRVGKNVNGVSRVNSSIAGAKNISSKSPGNFLNHQLKFDHFYSTQHENVHIFYGVKITNFLFAETTERVNVIPSTILCQLETSS